MQIPWAKADHRCGAGARAHASANVVSALVRAGSGPIGEDADVVVVGHAAEQRACPRVPSAVRAAAVSVNETPEAAQWLLSTRD